ncbi:alpha/beta fold hydrolase [Streptomyces sp. JV176]|uniref:thioesterase II family protein n=1 Tax=Streptomyces sp. JV176 TaxID=858630 RepID=UPI002E7683E1|nr:alpha/beta fold hydrolase [Streptomyces sp. JV176]MEE1799264.1 alpha/beta fold hydrolase [Streptomyces sp. JV176]
MNRATTGRKPATPWLVGRRTPADAGLTLYCFAHSGGSPGEFLRWADELPGAALRGVQLPGRGSHAGAAALTTLPEVLDGVLDQVDFAPPFAFFGHSMGGLLAYETARRIVARGGAGPRFLVVSSCAPPHHPRDEGLRDLPDAELLTAIDERYGGGVPTELLLDETVRALLMRSFRADVSVSETYRPTPGPIPDCPLYVMGGAHDLAPGLLSEWARYTTGPSRTTVVEGGHFYLREAPGRRALLALLNTLITSAG